MSYSTLDDIKNDISEEQLIQLTDDAGAGAVDEAKVTDAIADADSEINAYLRGRYTLPLDPAPRILKKLSVGIALYYLFHRRQIADETIKERYNNAVKLLDRIAKGEVQLVEADGDAVADEGGPQASKTTDDRIFSDEKLGNY
jgi:phage gp36-like protein